jgi:outer membrane protein TolC
MSKHVGYLVVAAALSMTATAAAQDGSKEGVPITESESVTTAMKHNPSLGAALIDQAGAAQVVIAEDNLFVPTLVMGAGATRTASPSLNPAGGTTVSETDSLLVGSELRHTFPWGTSMALSVDTSISRSRIPSSLPGGPTTSIGPGYGLVGRYTVVQPLLRGFGTDVGESSLRQAELNRTAADRAKDHLASLLLRDVLQTYWGLWNATRAKEIQRSALTLAVRRRDESRQRIDAGADAAVRIFPFETRVAELEQALLLAEADRRQRSVGLANLMGDDRPETDNLYAAATQVPETAAPPAREATLRRAVEVSQELAQLEAQLGVTEDRARIAGENERPRLDARAWVQAEGLGNREVPGAFEMFGKLQAVSGHVGFELELPVTGQRRGAQRRTAELASDASRERIHARQQQIEASVDTQLVNLEVSRRRVEIATRVVEFAEKEVKAAQERLGEGATIALVVHEAEDRQREAQLAVERARVDALQAQIELEHLTGVLLKRYASTVPNKPRPARRSLSAPERF